MANWAALVLVSLGTAAAWAKPAGTVALRGVPDPARAEQNWMLECQGCHRPDGMGSSQTTPVMAGLISSFLRVDGGREYLVRVPGVATAPLSDMQLAELLNWTVQRFDPAHLPADFRPYTPEEVAALRQHPFRIEAGAARDRIVERIDNGG